MRPPDTSATGPPGLWQKLVHYTPRYALGLLLLAAYQTAQWWFDTRLRELTNAAVGGAREVVLRLGVELVALAVASFGVRVASRMAIFNAGRHAEYELRSELCAHVQKLGPSFYRRINAGEVMSRATNDLTQVRLLLGFGVLSVINTAFALVSALAVTLSISARLTLAGLAVVPFMLLVMRHYARGIYTRTRENQEAIGKLSELVQTSIAGVRVVRAFGLEEREVERFEQRNQAYLEKNLRLARLRGALGPLIYAITSAGFLIVFWYGGTLMISGELDEGGLLAFLRALGRLTWPVMSLGLVVSIVQRGRAGYSRIAEIFRAEPDVTDGPGALPEGAPGHLEVRGLSFAYGDHRVLDDVSFELPPGASLAIVGRTGSGKSTLAALLTRLEPTPRGSVFVDGLDVCDLPLHDLRGLFGYADQSAFLFSTTVGRNVAYALDHPDAPPSLQAVQAASADAHVLEELLALPDGFETVVGERGVQLSGGQRQRVALARAFVSHPRILLLDDPLSAVDAATEAGILEAIDRQRAERGVVLITHRVAAAARCDSVLVLDEGRVVERGTHAELITRGGLYARLAEEQWIASELARLAVEGDAAEPRRRAEATR